MGPNNSKYTELGYCLANVAVPGVEILQWLTYPQDNSTFQSGSLLPFQRPDDI